MKLLGFVTALAIAWFAAPALAHECCHHDRRCTECPDCGYHSYTPSRSGGQTSAAEPVNLRTIEGKVAEIVYLPGPTAESGMVEVRLQTTGETVLVRLAPSGFLKRSDLHLREGNSVAVKGFPVAGMDGDLIVATEVRQADKTVTLRDQQGRPLW